MVTKRLEGLEGNSNMWKPRRGFDAGQGLLRGVPKFNCSVTSLGVLVL